MSASDEFPEELLRAMWLLDPESAERIEAVLKGRQQEARLAAIVEVDLRTALTAMALDIHRDDGALKHVSDAVRGVPVSGVSSEKRERMAKRLVAGHLGIDVDTEEDLDRAVSRKTIRPGAADDAWFYTELKALQLAVQGAQAIASEHPER